jgi:hypothetical protein
MILSNIIYSFVLGIGLNIHKWNWRNKMNPCIASCKFSSHDALHLVEDANTQACEHDQASMST